MMRFKTSIALFLSIAGPITSSGAVAQTSFVHAWEDRVRATSAAQPGWVVPVVAPSSVLVQLARVDFVRQYTSTKTLTWNYDNSKGVNLIPFARTEFDINLPPYIQHNTPKAADGDPGHRNADCDLQFSQLQPRPGDDRARFVLAAGNRGAEDGAKYIFASAMRRG